jgi:methyl-accepting chemotaxis protein
MRNLKVAQKLLIGFGAVIALTAIFAVVAVFSSLRIDTQYSYILDYPQNKLISLYDIDVELLSARGALRQMSVYTGLEGAEANINAQMNTIDQHVKTIEAELDRYIDLVQTDDELSASEKTEWIAQANNIRDLTSQWYNGFVVPIRQANLDNDRQEVERLYSQASHLATALFSSTDDLIDYAQNVTDTMSDDASASAFTFEMILIILAVVIAIISILFAVSISGMISKPLIGLASFMEKAGATGDVSLRPEDQKVIDTYARYNDEIGHTIAATSSFVKHVINIADELEMIAGGDLTTEIELLADVDVMGVSVKHTVDKFNDMFGEIQVSTTQAATGAKQIADGAQALAQGSTQQAAAVQQLSASISDIADKTKSNASMAGKAASLADSIKSSAEQGSRQMDEMMAAVKEINEASQSINKVIKVIDDIAFQTNILALNAAVEAARAGQHGKGFAVVAEEVRSLASKSAEAAKDTGSLIANSIEKAELGSRIATETAASLAKIVTGINESNVIIGDIAQSSEEQSAGIAQINTGIDQVAQVIQQNSATAQESAAASEELSSQSNMLEELISQFKLRKDLTGQRSLSPASAPVKRQLAMPEKITYAPGAGDYGKY